MFFRLFGFDPGARRTVFTPAPIVPMAIVGYRYKQIVVTDAQLQTLDVTPITVMPAEPGRVLAIIGWWIRTNKPGVAAWTTGPTVKVVYQGNTTNLGTVNLTSLLNSAATVNSFQNDVGANTAVKTLGTFNIIGKAIQVQFNSVATKGAGASATMDVGVAAYSFPLTL